MVYPCTESELEAELRLELADGRFFLHGSKMSEKYLVFFWANLKLVTSINST